MEPNPIFITFFSFLPSLIAAIRKTKNRKTLFIINGIEGLINIYISFNIIDSAYDLGLDGLIGISIILAFVWFGCLIAAIVSPKEQTTSKE